MKAKKILLCGLLGLVGGLFGVFSEARADERSAELLERMRNQMRDWTSYRVEFTTSTEGEGTTNGTLTVSGKRFTARVGDQELYFDGTTLWNYQPQNNEVTIERLDPDQPNVLSNPSRLLNVDPGDYTHRSLPDVSTAGGKKLRVVELTPKAQTQDYTTLTLYIDPETALLKRISIATPSSDRPIEMTLRKLQTNVPVSEATFRFDSKAHPGVEVIDFR